MWLSFRNNGNIVGRRTLYYVYLPSNAQIIKTKQQAKKKKERKKERNRNNGCIYAVTGVKEAVRVSA